MGVMGVKMRNDIIKLSAIAASAAVISLTGYSNASGKTAEPNIFNADVTAPMVKAAITEFESVCLPFITHETELTQDQNRAVFHSRMIESGYVFDSEMKSQTPFPLQQFQHTRTACPLDLPEPITKGKYTTFFGKEPIDASTLSKVDMVAIVPGTTIKSTATVVEQSCEILAVSITPVRYTNFIQEGYKKPNGPPTSAYLTWQDIPNDYLKKLPHAHASRFGGFAPTIKLRTIFPPANSCQINVSGDDVSADLVEDSIVQFDKDWSPKPVMIDAETKDIAADHHLWTQCSTQDDEHYVYTVGVKDNSLSLKIEVLQDDTYSSALKCKVADSLK